MATLLDREVEKLQERVRDLAFENARLRGEPIRQVDFAFPSRALEKALAERMDEATAAPRPRPVRPGHGPTPQAGLPVVEAVHELPQAERDCTVCGGTLAPMQGQYEDAEEITVNERSYTLVLHRRQLPGVNGKISTAPGPLKLIPGGRYSLDFAVHVAVQKYGEHLPLERQVEIMARHGLETTSQALWDQLEAAAEVLQPTYVSLGQWLLGQPLLHVDETGSPVNARGSKMLTEPDTDRPLLCPSHTANQRCEVSSSAASITTGPAPSAAPRSRPSSTPSWEPPSFAGLIPSPSYVEP